MLVPHVKLIPTQEQVLELLRTTGALREGHIELPGGMHARQYFQMPLAMRYHGNARVLNVALSRLLRTEHEVISTLPACAVVAPASGGIPVAFGVREALDAEQIVWAEKEDGTYRFRQYLDARGLKCILVDDLVRTGNAINYMVNLIKQAGATVIAIGSLVHFRKADLRIGDIPYLSLVTVDVEYYRPDSCPMCKSGEPVEKVWV